MLTTYKCVNIKSKDTHLIKNTLKYYKEKALRFFEQNICQDEEPFEGYFNFIRPTFIMFEYEEDDYTFFVHSNNALYPASELCELSQKVQAPCLYTLYYDDDYYTIELYDKGMYITGLCKEFDEIKGINGKDFDSDLLFNVLGMNDKQKQIFQNALQESNLFKSFGQLEYAFETSLFIDYDHTDEKTLEEMENTGSKYTII